MKNMKKFLTICLCLVAVMAATVMGTLAYLTDQQATTNTFTVGQVDITLDEAKVNTDGTPVGDTDRVTENTYHLIPGQTYTKDPTLTVKANSEEAYVRMLVIINCKSELDAIFALDGAKLINIFNGYDANIWIYEEETVDAEKNTITYEFRYQATVEPTDNDSDGTKDDLVLDALFDSFTVPGEITGEQLATLQDNPETTDIDESLKITVEGHAIQAAGFENADAAWTAFDEQVKK